MRGLRSLLVLSMLVVASCTGAVASPPPNPPPEPPRAPRVSLVGDSISDAAGPVIDAAFAREGWRSDRVSIPSQEVADMRSYITDAARLQPDVVVIELGTNDMGSVALADDDGAPAPDARAQQLAYAAALEQLDGALRDMQDVPCVVWLDVADWSDLYFGADGHYNLMTWAPPYNAQLRERQAQHPNLHIVSYAEQIRARGMAWIDENLDGGWRIHPQTASAQQVVADIMVRGVRDACGA